MRTNQTTSLSFFFFSCVCWLLSLVQSSPVQPPPPQFPIGLNYCKKKKKISFGVSNFKLINLLSNKLIYLFQNQPIIVVVVVITFNVVFYCSYYIWLSQKEWTNKQTNKWMNKRIIDCSFNIILSLKSRIETKKTRKKKKKKTSWVNNNEQSTTTTTATNSSPLHK